MHYFPSLLKMPKLFSGRKLLAVQCKWVYTRKFYTSENSDVKVDKSSLCHTKVLNSPKEQEPLPGEGWGAAPWKANFPFFMVSFPVFEKKWWRDHHYFVRSCAFRLSACKDSQRRTRCQAPLYGSGQANWAHIWSIDMLFTDLTLL